MKEKNKHSKKYKKQERESKKKDTSSSSSSSSHSDSDEWVEKESQSTKGAEQGREDWMAMTGMFKTYSKDDVKPKREEKEKKHIDSYNPGTSTRELNPYWKDGGTGLPQSPESFRKSRPFVKPSDDDDYYSKSSSSREYKTSRNERDNYDQKKQDRNHSYDQIERQRRNDNSSGYQSRNSSNPRFMKPTDDDDYYVKSSTSRENDRRYSHNRSYRREKDDYHIHGTNYERGYNDSGSSNWKKKSEPQVVMPVDETPIEIEPELKTTAVKEKQKNVKYLSDEKMNKLAAKIVKAEIMGDTKTVEELKAKLDAAREYRKENPDAGNEEEDDRVMLTSMNSAGNIRPLSKADKGDPRSKGGKRKADTHDAGQRMKYFGNDDKYNLAQMFEQEKYGNNNDEAELAQIASKHKNPNDDLDDIFVDEISKNRNEAKDSERERQKAINQHKKMEKSLEGCEYCVDSKNMLKHLMVSCGKKVYLALPARRSLVKGQCIITTIQHSTCVTAVDEDVWEEIMDYRKALTKFFNSQNKDVVFYETATRLHRYPHMVIYCVPLPRDVGDVASIYFKKALLECEAEWSMNKKVVELKGRNIRKGIPKGLPYFWIDFGMDPGFAHVIEDQQLFPKTFAEETVAGILDLDHQSWKNPQKEYGDFQRKKVIEFIKEWKPFDTIAGQ